MSINVHINGDRSLFNSKRAIERIKKDVREKKFHDLDSKNYINEDYTFKYKKENDTIYLDIVLKTIKYEEDRKEALRQKLRNKYYKTPVNKKKLAEMKKNIPKKILQTYGEVFKLTQNPNIPSPDKIFNDVDKYKSQISMLMDSKLNLNENAKVNSTIRNYFKALGEHFNIEPMNINEDYLNQVKNYANENFNKNTENSETEDEDTEDES